VTNTKCRIDTVISPDDGHSHPKHVEKRNKHIKKNCAPSWLYLQDYCKELPNNLVMEITTEEYVQFRTLHDIGFFSAKTSLLLSEVEE
jgi:hypothetical protein